MESLRERVSHACSSAAGGAQPPLLPQTVNAAQRHERRSKLQRQPSPLSPMHSSSRCSGNGSGVIVATCLRVLGSRRFLSAVLAVTLLLHCAMRLPALHPPPADFADLASLSSDRYTAAGAGERGGGGGGGTSAKLIPRILHQTYSSTAALTPRLRRHMLSWRAHNPGWEVRFYDDQDCLEFVRREFPQYLEAFRRLAKPVEHADLFRYLVVLRHGGVYADVDAECRQPLDGLIESRDTLLVGWEADFSSAEKALDGWSVRTRPVAQWVFAAAAGHPALRDMCDRIAERVRGRAVFSTDGGIDTQERTGVGLFTDVVLEHAARHPPAKRDDPWGVRLLPRAAFGAPLQPGSGLSPADPGVVALHHQLGAWRLQQHPWFWQRWLAPRGRGSQEGGGNSSERGRDEEDGVASMQWRRPSREERAAQLVRMQAAQAAQRLFPVSAAFSPPFDLMTHLAGTGEQHSGQDVGAALTTHGSWQPSVQPSRRPTLTDAVVGSMGGQAASKAVLVDVGAGYGLVALAAAARGHRVVAFELAPRSLEALEAAIARNGFGHLIDLQRLPLGGPRQEGYICLEPKAAAGVPPAARAEMARGYAAPSVHAVPAESCQLMAKRTPGASAVGSEEQVAAIRVSANGWEGWVLEGFAPLIQAQLPPVIALEWSPTAMRATGYGQPLRLLQWLHGLGYIEASHSGYVCDERWYSITYGVRRRGGVSPEDLASLRQPTWCRLLPENWALLLERSGSTPYPETLLLINRAAGNASDGGGGGGAALGALSQEGHAARRGRAGGAGGGGAASGAEDAELEASVATALKALERAEHAVLRPAQQQQRKQEQGRAQGGGNATAVAAAAGAAAADGQRPHAGSGREVPDVAAGSGAASRVTSTLHQHAAAAVSALAAAASLADEQALASQPAANHEQQSEQTAATQQQPQEPAVEHARGRQ
eukprot:scaffold14.g1125.t1